MKTQVFGVYVLRPELANVITLIEEWTAYLHALYLQDLPFRHIDCQVIGYALFALLVATVEPKHLLLGEETVADRALDLQICLLIILLFRDQGGVGRLLNQQLALIFFLLLSDNRID